MDPTDAERVTDDNRVARRRAQRPGDELRQGQRVLELQLRQLVTAFNRNYGVTIAAIAVQYVEGSRATQSQEPEPVVRVTLET